VRDADTIGVLYVVGGVGYHGPRGNSLNPDTGYREAMSMKWLVAFACLAICVLSGGCAKTIVIEVASLRGDPGQTINESAPLMIDVVFPDQPLFTGDQQPANALTVWFRGEPDSSGALVRPRRQSFRGAFLEAEIRDNRFVVDQSLPKDLSFKLSEDRRRLTVRHAARGIRYGYVIAYYARDGRTATGSDGVVFIDFENTKGVHVIADRNGLINRGSGS